MKSQQRAGAPALEFGAFHYRQVHEGGCHVERSSTGALHFFDA